MATSEITTTQSKTGSQASFRPGIRIGLRRKSSVATQHPSAQPVEASRDESKSDSFFGSTLMIVLQLVPFILFAVAVLVALSR